MKIIGHSRELARLEVLASSTRAPQALILGGPVSVGKSLLARYFFWKVCFPSRTREEFERGSDAATQQILDSTHPDVLEVAPDEAEITIGQIRAVRQFVSRTPFGLPAKLVVVTEAHRLNAEAANALLKSFEEPSPSTYIILLSARPRRILPTLRSRAVSVFLRQVPEGEMLSHFSAKEQTALRSEAAWIGGRPGLARRFLADLNDPEIVFRREEYGRFLELWRSRSLGRCMRAAERLADVSHLEVALESGLLAARTSFLTGAPIRLTPLARTRAALAASPLNRRLALEDMFFSALFS
jgi:DNA polymerase-3 subunit delta'